MKRYLPILILFLCSSLGASAQEDDGQSAAPNFSVWAKGGFNLSNMTAAGGGMSVSYTYILRLTGGLSYNRILSRRWSLQPELLYNTVGAKIEGFRIGLGYISVPLLAKYTIRGTALGILAGPQVSYFANSVVRDSTNDPIGLLPHQIKDFDFGAVGGIDYTFNGDLNISARYQAGFLNVAENTSGGATLKNKAFSIMVAYRLSTYHVK